MANTVSILTYTNTFGDWVNKTNALANEVTDIGKNNWHKNSGTLFLDSVNTGLQVANNAIIGGQLQIQGIGSSAVIQNNLTVSTGQVYFSNTTLGLTNSGKAIINGLLSAEGDGIGLFVANNAIIQGDTIIGEHVKSKNSTVENDAIVKNNLKVLYNTTTHTLQANGTTTLLGNVVIGSEDGAPADLKVTGNLIITGDSIVDIDRITLRALVPQNIGQDYDFIVVNRGEDSNPVNANSQIRWNEPARYWDIRDVASPTNYYRILTNQHLSNSISTANSTIAATSQAVKTLNDNAANNILTFQSQIASNVSVLNANVASAYSRANTSANTFIGSTGLPAATPIGGIITFSSVNGVTTSGSGSILTINTAQDLRTTASPTFQAISLTAPLLLINGGTGAVNKSDALINLLPPGITPGYVFTTGGPGNFYWSAPTGGSGGSGGSVGVGPGTTISSTRSLTLAANAGQKTFVSPAFIAGSNQVRLYIDGVRQFDGYNETITTASFTGSISASGVLTVTGAVTGSIAVGMILSGSGVTDGIGIISFGTGTGDAGTYNTNQAIFASSTNITGSTYKVVLDIGVNSGDSVLVEVDGYKLNSYYANNITFTSPQGGIISSVNTIQLAINDLESRKATLLNPEFTGTPTTPTASSGTNTTQIASTAYVRTAINALPPSISLISPAFTGTPTTPTAIVGTDTTQIASTAYVKSEIVQYWNSQSAPTFNLNSPEFTGTPTTPTASSGTNTTQIASTAFVAYAINALPPATFNLNSPAFTGTPTTPTATSGTNTTQIASTAYVRTAISNIPIPVIHDTTGNSATATTANSCAKLSTASGSAPSYSARAWVNFSGWGAVAIRASGNVSYITDNSVGNYTIHFDIEMPDANYAVTGITNSHNTNNASTDLAVSGSSSGAVISLLDRYQVRLVVATDFSNYDKAYVSVVIHR